MPLPGGGNASQATPAGVGGAADVRVCAGLAGTGASGGVGGTTLDFSMIARWNWVQYARPGMCMHTVAVHCDLDSNLPACSRSLELSSREISGLLERPS